MVVVRRRGEARMRNDWFRDAVSFGDDEKVLGLGGVALRGECIQCH